MIGSCVVDASIGIKLFLVEEHSEAVEKLFTELTAFPASTFFVPDLFFSECGNVLWKYAEKFGYPHAEARQDIQDLIALSIETVSTTNILIKAFDLALEWNITVYDACYVALAIELDVPLITADMPLVNKLVQHDIPVLSAQDLTNILFD